MSGETNLAKLLQSLKPEQCAGEYVFCTVTADAVPPIQDAVFIFREPEGFTVIVEKKTADRLQLAYSFVASWIMLTVHSSLEAVGLTAAFSAALANAGISCNVVAGFYHDHIFVPQKDTRAALEILDALSKQ